VVSLQGEIESSEVKGQVKAQLSGLAAKLADVGVSGTGSINNEQYQNVLRQDLAFKRRPAARAEIRVRGYPSPRRSHRGSIGSGNNISAGSPILLVRPTQTLANLVASGEPNRFPTAPFRDGSAGGPGSLATMFRPQFGLAFIGPDHLARFSDLLHLRLPFEGSLHFLADIRHLGHCFSADGCSAWGLGD